MGNTFIVDKGGNVMRMLPKFINNLNKLILFHLFVVLLTSLACSQEKKNDSSELKQRFIDAPASGDVAKVKGLLKEGTKYEFGLMQNDNEGFSGVKWGASTAAFCALYGEEKAEILGSDKPCTQAINESQSWNNWAGQYSFPINRLLGFPQRTENGFDIIDSSFMPANIRLFMGNIDNCFGFINGNLVLGLVTVSEIKLFQAALEKKHTKVETHSFNYAKADSYPYQCTTTLYRRGNTNTRIYFITTKCETSYGPLEMATLMYIPNAYYEQIRQDVQKELQQFQQEVLQQQTEKENAKRDEIDKLTN